MALSFPSGNNESATASVLPAPLSVPTPSSGGTLGHGVSILQLLAGEGSRVD
jgi:hypothetical protein